MDSKAHPFDNFWSKKKTFPRLIICLWHAISGKGSTGVYVLAKFLGTHLGTRLRTDIIKNFKSSRNIVLGGFKADLLNLIFSPLLKRSESIPLEAIQLYNNVKNKVDNHRTKWTTSYLLWGSCKQIKGYRTQLSTIFHLLQIIFQIGFNLIKRHLS